MLHCKIERPELTPKRAHETDAGLDLKAKDDYLLDAYVRTLVGTGVSVKIPVGHVGLLVPRSSLSKRNIFLTNSVGIIDSGYRGELMASLMYIPKRYGSTEMIIDHQHIDKNERIVQLVILPIPYFEVVEWKGDIWDDTERGEGGFGSSGIW